jgi:cobalt/nickel transport protein
VLHVQTQKNWDASFKQSESVLKIVPLTRPYGLFPGMIFQARVGNKSQKVNPFGEGVTSMPSVPIEVERYNPAPPKKLPPDELITFKTKTDPNGVFTFAFPDPGWWCMTADWQEKDRQWIDAGKQGPLRERTTLWVHVDEKK